MINMIDDKDKIKNDDSELSELSSELSSELNEDDNNTL